MEVYRITNTITGKVYIGSTKYTKEYRWSTHLKDLKKGDSRPLYEDIRKYGIDAFDLTTLHKYDSNTTISELQKVEYLEIQQIPEELRYNINITDSMQSARVPYLTEGHKRFKEESKGIFSEKSYTKRRESKKYIYTYKGNEYRGIVELHKAIVLEGYDLSKDQVKHLAQRNSFSKANKERYPELIDAISVYKPYPHGKHRPKKETLTQEVLI